MTTPLFRRFPEVAAKLPYVRLGRADATPVERAPSLGDGVWVKRDDQTAPRYGGNKVRKLELLLADALARGRRAVLTLGGTGSNHVLATALHARALGLQATHAVLFPQPASDDVERKRAAYRALGVRTARVPGKALVPFAGLGRMAASLFAGHGAPYYIGPGGSSPLGTLGYVNAALELAEQIAAGALPAPASIYVPLGSGGTAAGLLLGLRLAGLPTRLKAVQVVPRPWTSATQTAALATRAARLLAAAGAELPEDARRFGADDLDMISDQLGRAYGAATPAAEEAVTRGAAAGLTLETTYTGKTLAALLAAPAPAQGAPVIFWLTYCPFQDEGASAQD